MFDAHFLRETDKLNNLKIALNKDLQTSQRFEQEEKKNKQ